MHIVGANDGQSILKAVRLLHQVFYQAVVAQHGHAKAAGILDLFDIQNAVQTRCIQATQVGIKDRVDKDDEYWAVEVLSRQPDGVGLAQQFLLLHKLGWIGVTCSGIVFFNLLAQPADDKDQFVHRHVEVGQFVQDVAHHRLAGHIEQGLGLGPGVGSHSLAKACQGYDDFHGFLVASIPIERLSGFPLRVPVSQIRVLFVPFCRLLVGLGHPQNRGLVEGAAHDLQADGQSNRVKAAGQ